MAYAHLPFPYASTSKQTEIPSSMATDGIATVGFLLTTEKG